MAWMGTCGWGGAFGGDGASGRVWRHVAGCGGMWQGVRACGRLWGHVAGVVAGCGGMTHPCHIPPPPATCPHISTCVCV